MPLTDKRCKRCDWPCVKGRRNRKLAGGRHFLSLSASSIFTMTTILIEQLSLRKLAAETVADLFLIAQNKMEKFISLYSVAAKVVSFNIERALREQARQFNGVYSIRNR
ncbi:hypothetical protein H2248_007787 [Termitomyces sp. 'cryptogamus']|nr:hypothetical protein H2248_007787 [Termitomyces sp. 'cryptogamus']